MAETAKKTEPAKRTPPRATRALGGAKATAQEGTGKLDTPTPPQAPPAAPRAHATPRAKTEGANTAKTTLDLDLQDYRKLKIWAITDADDARLVEIMRALVGELLAEPDLQRRIVNRIQDTRAKG
ncbi:hypothetical protein [Embleya sp. NPDC005575]|uniref:hypothetical protein n=1 Tax=Embleya sp. NPDC005575 TaxID=3156892 RepID=UPI0033A38E56